jgi:hypothetical protein
MGMGRATEGTEDVESAMRRADCGEHRQAAGASAEVVTRVPPNTNLAQAGK